MMKKSAKVLLKPSSEPAWETPNRPYFLETDLAKNRAACAPTSRPPTPTKIFKTNFKTLKHIAVDDLAKAYPMVPLLDRSNLAGQYL
jgi:hypothetical protein